MFVTLRKYFKSIHIHGNDLLNFVVGIVASILSIFLSLLRLKLIILYFGSTPNGLYQTLSQLFVFLTLFDFGRNGFFYINFFKSFYNKDFSSFRSNFNSLKLLSKKIVVFMIVFISISLFAISGSNFIDILPLVIGLTVSMFVPILFEQYIISYLFLFDLNKEHYIPKIVNFMILACRVAFTYIFIGSLDFVTLIMFESLIHLLGLIILYFISKIRYSSLITGEYKIITHNFNEYKVYFYSKISGLLILNTDNLIISSFYSLQSVSIFSTYLYIVNIIIEIVSSGLNSLIPKLTGLYQASSRDHENDGIQFLLKKVVAFVAFFVSIATLFGVDSFMSIYLNNSDVSYLLNNFEKYVILSILFIKIIRLPVSITVNAKAIFQYTYKLLFLEGVVNIILSISLIKLFGVIGVYLSSLICYLTISLPNFINALKISDSNSIHNLKYYYKMYILFTIIFVVLTSSSIEMQNVDSYYSWLLLMIAFSLVFIFFYFIGLFIFSKTQVQGAK